MVALLCLLPLQGKAAPGDLFVSDILSGSIVRFSLDGSQREDFATGLNNPLGLAFDSSGRLYSASVADNTVYQFSLDGSTRTPFGGAGAVSNPIGLAFDSGGNLFVSSAGSHNLLTIDPGGGAPVAFGLTSFSTPYGVALKSNGQIVVADEGFVAGGYYVYLLNPDAILETYYGGSMFYQPCALAVDAEDNILVANFDATGGFIEKIATNGTTSTLITGLRGPNGIAISGTGDIYISEYYAGEIQVYRPDGTWDRTFATGLTGPTMLAFQPVPEPSTAALLGSAPAVLAAITFVRRRRLRAAQLGGGSGRR